MKIYIEDYFEVMNWLVMMNIAFEWPPFSKMAADKIGKISMISDFNNIDI
jgi:hypothetical protein